VIGRHQLKKIATVTTILVVVIMSIILLIFGSDWETVLGAAGRASVALAATGGFWYLYNKWLWKIGFFRFGGWLSRFPDLNGRWAGTVQREVDDEPHPIVIEIHQTWTSLKFFTYSRNSVGKSLHTVVFVDDDSDVFGVVARWQSETKNLKEPHRLEYFHGTSVWRIEYLDLPGKARDRLRISDRYHTTRETSGSVHLTWKSKKRTHSFDGPGAPPDNSSDPKNAPPEASDA
jgi:hypothetical protein